MALFAKKGKTSLNPNIVTDGLIFYLDPNNSKCREETGTRHKDLIQTYSSLSALSAGILFSPFNTLTSFNNTTFLIFNTAAGFAYGNLGPDYALSALDNFTIQLWVKSKDESYKNKKFLSNTATISTNSEHVTVSSNFPTAPSPNLINGKYLKTENFANSKYEYQNGNFNFIYDDSSSKWYLRLNGVEYFYSNNNNGAMPSYSTNWTSNITSFKFNLGNLSPDFFKYNFYPGNSQIVSPYFPYSFSIPAEIYDYRPDLKSIPSLFLQKETSTSISNFLLYSDFGGDVLPTYNIFKSKTSCQYPWQTQEYQPTLSAIFVDSAIVFPGSSKFPISGYWFFHPNASNFNNNRPYYFMFKRGLDQNNENHIYAVDLLYVLENESGFGSNPAGWFVYIYYDSLYYSILSSSDTAFDPGSITNWELTPEGTNHISIYNTLSNFSTSYFEVPPITAYPEYKSYNLSVSAEDFSTLISGISISGANNILTFTYPTTAITDFGNKLKITNDWNLITVAQSGNKTLFNSNGNMAQFISNSNLTYNLSSLILTNEVIIGQIFIYNKFLKNEDIKQNYDNFKKRYEKNIPFSTTTTTPAPLPTTTTTTTPVPYVERYSYGMFFNGTNTDILGDKLASQNNWDDIGIVKMGLYFESIILNGTFIKPLNISTNTFYFNDFQYRDDGYGMGFSSYIDKLNELISEFNFNSYFLPAENNHIVGKINPDEKFKIIMYDRGYDYSNSIIYSNYYSIIVDNGTVFDIVENGAYWISWQ